MDKSYEEQSDGSVETVKIPKTVARRAAVYEQLKSRLTMEEIRFVLDRCELDPKAYTEQ